jgi:transketolase C-terminal domain/subunit
VHHTTTGNLGEFSASVFCQTSPPVLKRVESSCDKNHPRNDSRQKMIKKYLGHHDNIQNNILHWLLAYTANGPSQKSLIPKN